MIFDKTSALEKLCPDAKWVVKNDVIEWRDQEKQQPTNKQINDKIAELQVDYDAKQYQRDRLTEYPSIQELVVALYDEEDKQAIIEKRNAVKAKYPKPE